MSTFDGTKDRLSFAEALVALANATTFGKEEQRAEVVATIQAAYKIGPFSPDTIAAVEKEKEERKGFEPLDPRDEEIRRQREYIAQLESAGKPAAPAPAVVTAPVVDLGPVPDPAHA